MVLRHSRGTVATSSAASRLPGGGIGKLDGERLRSSSGSTPVHGIAARIVPESLSARSWLERISAKVLSVDDCLRHDDRYPLAVHRQVGDHSVTRIIGRPSQRLVLGRYLGGRLAHSLSIAARLYDRHRRDRRPTS